MEMLVIQPSIFTINIALVENLAAIGTNNSKTGMESKKKNHLSKRKTNLPARSRPIVIANQKTLVKYDAKESFISYTSTA
jgi:hypothetical protein